MQKKNNLARVSYFNDKTNKKNINKIPKKKLKNL